MTSAVSILLASAEPGTREAPRPDPSGRREAAETTPGLFGYVELEFIERLARRFAATRPIGRRHAARPHMRHPSSHARTTNRALGRAGQLLTHVEFPLAVRLCREDSAHGLRLDKRSIVYSRPSNSRADMITAAGAPFRSTKTRSRVQARGRRPHRRCRPAATAAIGEAYLSAQPR